MSWRNDEAMGGIDRSLIPQQKQGNLPGSKGETAFKTWFKRVDNAANREKSRLPNRRVVRIMGSRQSDERNTWIRETLGRKKQSDAVQIRDKCCERCELRSAPDAS